MLPKLVSRTARKCPSASSASSAVTRWSRPWLSETKLPERSSVHFTGRPSARAACSTQTYSGVDRRLHAERAADIAGEHVHLLGVDVEHLRDVALHAEHALRGDMQREAPVIVGADRGARLHRVDHDAAVDDLEARDMRGLGERGRDLLARRRSDNRARRCRALRHRAPARPGLTASSGLVTAGSGSMSSSIASAASFACSSVSATTQATGSPT